MKLPCKLPRELPCKLPRELPCKLPRELPYKLPRELPYKLPRELPCKLPHELPWAPQWAPPRAPPLDSASDSLSDSLSGPLPDEFGRTDRKNGKERRSISFLRIHAMADKRYRNREVRSSGSGAPASPSIPLLLPCPLRLRSPFRAPFTSPLGLAQE